MSENIVALTEQGDYGLGVHPVTDKQERADLQRRLNEMQNQAHQQQNETKK
jgi:hypothetical protein